MPLTTKVSQQVGLPERTFILDNGAYSLKAGYAPVEPTSDFETLSRCEVIPNCLVRTRDRKTYVAAQTSEITQWSEAIFRRPVEAGQLVNWEAEKDIWDHSFFSRKSAKQNVYIEEPESTTLILTEAPNTMPTLQKNADEIIMEEWGFGGYMRAVGPSLNAFNELHNVYETEASLKAHPPVLNSMMECLLVIDSGYSHTTITPIYQGKPLQRAVRRLDFGGKHLTNLLKEVVSIRHFDLHQDTKIVNDIKEDISFVSRNFKTDMEATWKGARGTSSKNDSSQDFTNDKMDETQKAAQPDVRVDYVLPDGIHVTRGFMRSHDPSAAAAKRRRSNAGGQDAMEVSMTLGNERFTIPEALFNPTDLGAAQPGLADGILVSLGVLPPLIQATMLANILVVGGNGNIRGFVERLEADLRALVRSDWMVRVRKMDDPFSSTWLGGARLATYHRDFLRDHGVTKAEYMEYGSGWVARRFVGGGK